MKKQRFQALPTAQKEKQSLCDVLKVKQLWEERESGAGAREEDRHVLDSEAKTSTFKSQLSLLQHKTS